MVHLHPTNKVLLHHVISGDVGVKKNGTNGMLRRKVQHWKQKSWRYWTGYVQPKEESQDPEEEEEEEEEKEVEEPSKRSRIAFEDRRLKNLDLKRGRMGPDSSPSGSGDSPRHEQADDELQELLQVEEGELQAEAAEEEEPQGVGELTRFDGSAPKPFPASTR